MILDGKKISEEILTRLRDEVAFLRARGIVPGFGIVLIGDNPASRLYVSMKQKDAEELGMRVDLVVLPADITEEIAIAEVSRLSCDPMLDGIIVQLPLPKGCSQERICSAIAEQKDIDCLNPKTMKRLMSGDTSLHPPTAEAVRLLIQKSERELAGAHACVIGSGFFATQITHHLRNSRASVEQVPFRAEDRANCARRADILISATGRGHSIGPEHIKEGAIVIDVGVSRRGDEVIGDVDFERVKDKACAITPVPGGVGPVTVACLLDNVVKAASAR